jgi:translation initiation factor 2B subunit (eIF-2B alpha/beta/delta family)
MPLSLIVKQVQNRMSFYAIYELIDNITANKVKIKKIKNLVHLGRSEMDKFKDEVEEKVKRLEQANDGQGERI